MKFSTLILFGLLVGAFGYSWEPEELECVEEQNLDKSWIEKVNNPLKKPVVIDDKKLNDFLECTWKKQGLLTPTDDVNWDKLIEIIETNGEDSGEVVGSTVIGGKMLESIKQCSTLEITGTTPGQKCAKAQNCVGEQFRKVFGSL